MGKYDKRLHDDFVKCRRCYCKNSPPGSGSFEKHCYNCGVELDTEPPVSKGDEMVLFVDDIHEEGYGVAKTEEGFVVLVEGVIPEEVVKVRIKDVRESSAVADVVSRDTKKDIEDFKNTNSEEDEEEKRERKNFWGE